jgi:HK97 family phage prohead protease
MTDMPLLRAEAAKDRAAAGLTRSSLPRYIADEPGEPKREDVKFSSEFRSELVEKDGQDFYLVEGYASMTERAYPMWDAFGPYDEIVSAGAFDVTLAAEPMVIFRFNHAGTPMANTANGRLQLSADSLGLGDRAWINPKRADVRELITAIEDKDVTEQSFMFLINNGEWNDEFTQFRIAEVNLDRGDVGPVTYGANPYTMIASRAGDFLSAIPNMPVLAAREAMSRLAARTDLTPVTPVSPKSPPAPVDGPTGTSLQLLLAQLEVDKQNHL